jgi:ABC-type phosphate transport system substrate-binding protein
MTRRIVLVSLVLLASLVLVPSTPAAADATYRVIVHRDNPITSVTKGQLAKMLTKKTTSWKNGNKVMPVDQRVGSKVRDAMSRAVHGRTARAIKNWWNQQIFAGKGVPPPELGSDAKVVSYVNANPGAIGYVSIDAPIGDAKSVAVTE